MNSTMHKRKKNSGLKFALMLLIVLVLAASACFVYYQGSLKPVGTDEAVQFEIPNGSTVNSVLEDLQKAGLIQSALTAKIFAKLSGNTQIRAGSYELNKSWDVETILQYVNGNNAISNEVAVTIPEGTWAMNIAGLVAEKTNVTKEELLTLWSDKAFLKEVIEKYGFLDEQILQDGLHVPLEGYLFPETYNFYKETTARAVTMKLLDQTELELNRYQEDIDNSSLSLYELVTLASLVQFEANNPTDMKMVAGIFLKRLDIKMKLQASATVCYALYDDYKSWKDCEFGNLNIKSPYNTYVIDALPIGAISNPGRDALEAVFQPTESDYLYFVSDIKGDRTNHYAKTFAEHQKNVDKYVNN